MSTRKFYSKDGTLGYNVNFHVIEEEHTDLWVVPLTDEQAERIRAALVTLREAGIIGWFELEVRTIELDSLDKLGVRLRDLLPKGRRQRE